jgi:CubicO group peptidase (beta-lactamase class C family)
MSVLEIEIGGVCAAKYGAVKDAFAANLRDRDEVGAAFSLWVGGEPVVDLWGGWKDAARTKPWARDTVANVWSTTKGINAACFAMLVSRGQLAYDDPVARYWPAFAAAGKGAITVGTLLSHQAGLSGFTDPATMDDLLAGEAAAGRLAAQAPIWEPGTASGYHAISVGVLATALFARIEGRSIRQFVAEEIAAPYGLDFTIGLAPDQADRAAEMLAPPGMGSSSIGALNPAQIAALTNPSLDPRIANTAAWRAADLPSANGHGHARALAAFYAALLPNADPARRPASPAAIAQATAPRIEGEDLVLGLFARWGAGFLVNSEELYGPNPEAFGHSGWGGSFAFADPKADLAMGYVMNRMSDQLRGDPRAMALIEAVYRSV